MDGEIKEIKMKNIEIKEKIEEKILPSSTVEDTCTLEDACTVDDTCTVDHTSITRKKTYKFKICVSCPIDGISYYSLSYLVAPRPQNI